MYNVGVDIGGSKIAIGLVNYDGRIISKRTFSNSASKKNDAVVKKMYQEIKKLLDDNAIDFSNLLSVGIGFPGTVTRKGFVNAPNIDFCDYNLRRELAKYVHIPINIENDANCATIAEYAYGGLKGTNNAVLITLGTGVGGGIIINGKLHKGIGDGAGEIGHQVIMAGGKKCGCGKKGCYETYASTRAWVERVRTEILNHEDSILYGMVDGNVEAITARKLFDAMKKGDKFVKSTYEKHIEYVVVGIVNLMHILDPDAVAIGGGVSGQKEMLLDPIKKEFDKQMNECSFKFDSNKIKLAELGNDAGIIGAAGLYNLK